MSDHAAYRQMLRVAFEKLRPELFRLQRQLTAGEEVGAPALAELRQRVADLRRLVDALASGQTPIDQAISPELHRSYGEVLTAINGRLDKEPVAACELANRLVELIAVEIAWMPRL